MANIGPQWNSDDRRSGHIPDGIQYQAIITNGVNEFGIVKFVEASTGFVEGVNEENVEGFKAGANNSHFFCPFIWRVLHAARNSGQARFEALEIPEIPEAWLSYGERDDGRRRPLAVVRSPFRESIPADQTTNFFFLPVNRAIWDQIVADVIDAGVEDADTKFDFISTLINELRVPAAAAAPVPRPAAAAPVPRPAAAAAAPLGRNLVAAFGAANRAMFGRPLVQEGPIPVADARARLAAARRRQEEEARAAIARRAEEARAAIARRAEEARQAEEEAHELLEAQAATGNANAQAQLRPRIHEMRNAAYRGNAAAADALRNLERLGGLGVPNAQAAVQELGYDEAAVRRMIPELQRRASEEDIALLERLARRIPIARQALQGIERRRAAAAAEQQRREEAAAAAAAPAAQAAGNARRHTRRKARKNKGTRRA
jgi:hypothetical protein